MFGEPLALTSANLSSQPSSLNVEVRVTELSSRPQVSPGLTQFSLSQWGWRWFAGIARQESLMMGSLPSWQGLSWGKSTLKNLGKVLLQSLRSEGTGWMFSFCPI